MRKDFNDSPLTLADVPVGMRVRIEGFANLPLVKQDHLLAYGLAPGQWVEIKQHYPAVVAQVGYTELALEPEVALQILVGRPMPVRGRRHSHRHGTAKGRGHRRRGFFRRGGRRHRPGFLSKFLHGEDE